MRSTHSLNAPGNQWTNSSEAHGRDLGLGQARAHSVSQRSAPGQHPAQPAELRQGGGAGPQGFALRPLLNSSDLQRPPVN